LTVSWADLGGEPAPARSAPIERTPLTLDELVGLELEPGTRDVARRMLEHGASSEFARTILAEVLREGSRGAYAIDAAAALLARAVPILPSPRRPRRHERVPLFVFVGPTGVGKTTSLVKLGRRLREAGRRVAFASLDPLAAAPQTSAGRIERGQPETDIDRGDPLARCASPTTCGACCGARARSTPCCSTRRGSRRATRRTSTSWRARWRASRCPASSRRCWSWRRHPTAARCA
jgi:hypothetical protein